MKYLPRDKEKEKCLHNTLKGCTYQKGQDNTHIRQALVSIQRPDWLETDSGFCAYTERFFEPLHAVDIEHFDPRKKGTPEDNATNWFAVLHAVNLRKARKIENHLPMLHPLDPSLTARIRFDKKRLIFLPVNSTDREVENLLDWLGTNLPGVVAERKKHIERIKRICPEFPALFWELAREDPMFLSFLTAILHHFQLNDDEAAAAYASTGSTTSTPPPTAG